MSGFRVAFSAYNRAGGAHRANPRRYESHRPNAFLIRVGTDTPYTRKFGHVSRPWTRLYASKPLTVAEAFPAVNPKVEDGLGQMHAAQAIHLPRGYFNEDEPACTVDSLLAYTRRATLNIFLESEPTAEGAKVRQKYQDLENLCRVSRFFGQGVEEDKIGRVSW